MNFKHMTRKFLSTLIVFTSLTGVGAGAYADEPIGTTVVNGVNRAWYNYFAEQLLLMQQEQADRYAEFMRAQQEMMREQTQAMQEFEECMGRAGFQDSQCRNVAAQVNQHNVEKCGDLPGAGISVGVELSFGIVNISGELDGEAKVQHCKDAVEANYEVLQTQCEVDHAEDRLDCLE